jgi:hypothetical protein
MRKVQYRTNPRLRIHPPPAEFNIRRHPLPLKATEFRSTMMATSMTVNMNTQMFPGPEPNLDAFFITPLHSEPPTTIRIEWRAKAWWRGWKFDRAPRVVVDGCITVQLTSGSVFERRVSLTIGSGCQRGGRREETNLPCMGTTFLGRHHTARACVQSSSVWCGVIDTFNDVHFSIVGPVADGGFPDRWPCSAALRHVS